MLQTSAAPLHGRVASSDPPADLAHFVELKNRNDQLSQQAIEEIKNLDKRLNRAKGADRRRLQAAEEDAQTRLHLLDAVAQGINDLVEFVQSSGAGPGDSGHLDSTIDELAQSIPEVTGPSVSSATVPLQEANSRTAGRDAGILGLASDVSAMKRKLHVVDEKIFLTDNLTLSANNLRIPLADFVAHLIQSAAIPAIFCRCANRSRTSMPLPSTSRSYLRSLSRWISKKFCWQSTSHTCCRGE